MRAQALLAAAAGVLLALPGLAQTAPTVEDVIAKNIEARGGKEKLAAVQSARATGKMTMGPMEVPFVMEWKAPNRIRQEFTVQGKVGVTAYDGSTAWLVMPFMGKTEPEKMTADDTTDMAQEAEDFVQGYLVDYQKKGHQVRLVGKKDVEGTEAYELEVTLKNGDVIHEFLDAESYLTIREETKVERDGQEVEVIKTPGSYKEVDGLVLPHTLSNQIKGAPAGAGGQTITVDKYEFGAAIEDSRFAFPAAAAAEKPAAEKPPGS